jgi:hypothetical protein
MARLKIYLIKKQKKNENFVVEEMQKLQKKSKNT